MCSRGSVYAAAARGGSVDIGDDRFKALGTHWHWFRTDFLSGGLVRALSLEDLRGHLNDEKNVTAGCYEDVAEKGAVLPSAEKGKHEGHVLLGHIMSTECHSRRSQHTLNLLETIGIRGIFVKPPLMTDKVVSNRLVQEDIFEKISKMEEQFVFVFEDDLAMHAITFNQLHAEIQRIYHATLEADVPFFYAGICGKKRVSEHRFVRRCAHAYAVRPERALQLLDETRKGKSRYMDAELE